MARWEQEIPAAEAAASAMAKELAAAEAQLEGLLEGIKGEVEAHHQALSKVGFGVCGRSRETGRETGLPMYVPSASADIPMAIQPP